MPTKYAYVFAASDNQIDLAHNLKIQLKNKTNLDLHFFQSPDGWFDKPQHILNVLEDYKKVCWLDNDIEILQNFDEIFTLADKGINGVPDYLFPLTLNTGVLVVDQKEYGLITLWAGMTGLKTFRSDQEALACIRKENRDSFGELPLKYNHQKWAIKNGVLPSEDTAIVHWTGSEGKVILRNKISQTAQ